MIGMTAQLCEQVLQRLDYYDHDNESVRFGGVCRHQH